MGCGLSKHKWMLILQPRSTWKFIRFWLWRICWWGIFQEFSLKGRSVGAGQDYHVLYSGGCYRTWTAAVEPAKSCAALLWPATFLFTGCGGASRWWAAVDLWRGVCFSWRRAVLPLQGSLGSAFSHQNLGASQVRHWVMSRHLGLPPVHASMLGSQWWNQIL